LLIEIKSRMLLPELDETGEQDEPLEDPRQQLVVQLLQYKQYRDAASVLEERGRSWSECFARLANDLPPRTVDPKDQPIREIELWDLVSALGRVLRANELAQPTNIIYDDTPIHVHMRTIHQRLQEEGQVAFSDMFRAGMHKSTIIGVFLALLELVRHHCVHAEQCQLHGEIYLIPGEEFPEVLALADVEEYQGGSRAGSPASTTTKPR
jgi:segregation and condensation protein A